MSRRGQRTSSAQRALLQHLTRCSVWVSVVQALGPVSPPQSAAAPLRASAAPHHQSPASLMAHSRSRHFVRRLRPTVQAVCAVISVRTPHHTTIRCSKGSTTHFGVSLVGADTVFHS
ncbi:hypothetical protein NDU88_003815 [Pleurodeles waltl]|uniref:Secreted protein n=1 Tax=Pleurodeles waltl TaxID=8319 RepID=A0AAV7NMJ7_PLEWA|nr:hypothetical protein NDU88_003815 [Pleurodeles waltl]